MSGTFFLMIVGMVLMMHYIPPRLLELVSQEGHSVDAMFQDIPQDISTLVKDQYVR